MDETTMALLTGLLGTAIGAVLIGGALLAAYLLGKERGRRLARMEDENLAGIGEARFRQLETSHAMLQLEVEQLRRAVPGVADGSRLGTESIHRTPH